MNKTEVLELKVAIGSGEQEVVKTQFRLPERSKFYYLPTEYKEPKKCYLVDYIPTMSVNGLIRVMATVEVGKFTGLVEDIKLKDVSPQMLFESKSNAGDYYLEHRDELDWKFLTE